MQKKLKQFTTLTILTCAIILLALTAVDTYAQEITFRPKNKFTTWKLWDVYMPNHSLTQNMYINYAWEITKDKEFLYLLKNENGDISPDRRHDPSNNVVGVDFGFCGINDYYHPHIVNDPRFKDWQWQLDTCYNLYKDGVTFYGKGKGWKVRHFFKFRI